MEILRKYIMGCIALVLVTACNQLEIPDSVQKPVLCIVAKCTDGDSVHVRLTRTRAVTDDNINLDVDDATYTLSVNGQPQPHGYKVRSGDRITISANSAAYGSATAECTVPMPCPSVKAEFTPTYVSVDSVCFSESIGTTYYVKFNAVVTVEVTDAPGRRDFYEFDMSAYTHNGQGGDGSTIGSSGPGGYIFLQGMINLDNEPLFGEHMTELENWTGNGSQGFRCFTDRQFEGGTYKLHIEIENGLVSIYPPSVDKYGKEDVALSITVSTLSADTYKWSTDEWYRNFGLLNDLAEVGLAPFMPAFSNVSTGAGIVLAGSPLTIRYSIREFVDSVLANS